MSSRRRRGLVEITSPPWRTETRVIAAVLLIILTSLVLYSVRQLFVPLALALLLAYLLHPIVLRLTKHLRMPRTPAVLLVYFVLLLLMAGATTGAGLAISQQISGLVANLRAFSFLLPRTLSELATTTLTIGPWTFDLAQINLNPLIERLVSSIQPLLSQTGTILTSVLGATATTVGFTLLVFVLGYYLLKDYGSLDDAFLALVPEPYREDFERLIEETGLVWQAFLRGQLLLGLVIGAVTAVAYSAVGLRFALGLGLIAGLLEFVPIFGPLIAGLLAVLVALFQNTNIWGLSPLVFAAIVTGIAVIIQQVENNVLVPRIIGHSLDLHPLVVLLAAIGGGILAGVLGVLLAAPVVATARLWLGYIYRKTVGIDSWPGPVMAAPVVARRPGLRQRLLSRLRRRRPPDLSEAGEPEPAPDATEGEPSERPQADPT